jgi:hypothetical protein
MFDGSTQVMVGGSLVETEKTKEGEPWRELHRRFRSAATRRGALDHEELALIREAITVQIWRELGMVSIREYLEHVMGYTPGVASERVRVAEALDAMPALDGALASGELSFSAVKAITRIATRKTERAWLAACRGKKMREIEELLSEREAGDRPESPRRPDLRLQDVHLKLPPHVIALQREVRKKLEAELGERIDDAYLYEVALRSVLRGTSDAKKAPTQIAISVCPSCKVARQRAGNVEDPDRARGVRARGLRRAVARQHRQRPRTRGAGHHACATGIRARARQASLSRAGLPRGAAHRGPSHRAPRRWWVERPEQPDRAVRRSPCPAPRWPADDQGHNRRTRGLAHLR